jgi:hypothetical protein
MDILAKWREARAITLRKEFEDVIAKAPCPKAPARTAFLSNIARTHATLLALYAAASPSERGVILRFVKNAASTMWRQGAWPSALGFEIACLNVASRFEPGADAAYVKAETDKILEEAVRTQRSMDRCDLPAADWVEGFGPHPAARVATGRHHLRQLAMEARQIKQAAIAKIADQTLQLSHRVSR